MTKTPFRPHPPSAASSRTSNGYSDNDDFPYPSPPRRRANWLVFLTATVLTLMALIIVYGLFFRDNDSLRQKAKEKPAVQATDEPMDIDSGEPWMGESDGSAVHLNVPGDGGGAVTPTETPDEETDATPADGKATTGATSSGSRLPVYDDPPVMDEPITSIEAEAQKKAAAKAPKAPAKPAPAPSSGVPTPPLPGQ